MRGVLLGLILIAGTAYGQSAAEVSGALADVRVQEKLMETALETLAPMAQGQDKEAIGNLQQCAVAFRLSSAIVAAAGNPLPKMRDPEDAAVVRLQLQYYLRTVVDGMGTWIQSANSNLALIRSPAAVAGGTRVRDAMVAIRDQLRILIA